MKIILASKSAIRKKMFDELGISYEIIVSNADESFKDSYDFYEDQLKDISLRKAETVFSKNLGDCIIVGSDYMVIQGNKTDSTGHILGKIYGKPHSETDAISYLNDFRNGLATCLCGTSIIVYKNNKKEIFQDIASSVISIDDLSDSYIKEYVKNPDVYKTAAGFNLAMKICPFVHLVSGDISTSTGLHIEFVKEILEKYNI